MTAPLPLEGALVLDLADEPAVAAGRYLADLGARVIRIESAGGDRVRRIGPWVEGEPGIERALRHLLYNQGKESLALALDSAEAWDLIDLLAEQADVVIGPLEKSERARRSFERLQRRAEQNAPGAPSVIDIVFRRADPEQAATDLIAMAAGSQLVCNGFPETAPDYPAGKLGYKQTSYCAAAAAAASIWQRRRGGGAGSSVVSMQEAVVSTMIQAANQNLYRWHGMVAERDGTGGLKYPVVGSGFGSYEQGAFEDGEIIFIDTPGATYQCRDGSWVTYLGNPTSTAWENFPTWYAEVTGDRSLLSEPWTSQAYRVAHRDEMREFTRRFCAAQDRADLVRRAQAEGDLGLPVQTAYDLSGDEHLHARGFFRAVEHPQLGRSITLPRSPYRSTAFEPPARPAPALGADSAQVLSEIGGLSADAIQHADRHRRRARQPPAAQRHQRREPGQRQQHQRRRALRSGDRGRRQRRPAAAGRHTSARFLLDGGGPADHRNVGQSRRGCDQSRIRLGARQRARVFASAARLHDRHRRLLQRHQHR